MAVENQPNTNSAPWTRVIILIIALAAAIAISKSLTGSFVPTTPKESAVFQSSLLLIVLGSALLEHKFTRPADSVVNALGGVVTLVTVYAHAPRAMWWIVFLYCIAVFILALTCVVVSTGPEITGWKKTVADRTYRPAVYFGQARMLHSVVFLFAVLALYGARSREAAVLVVYWGIYIAVWPLQIPRLLTALRRPDHPPRSLGKVVRREWPDLIRVDLRPGVEWSQESAYLFQDAEGHQHLVVPLYKQLRDQQAVATALHVEYGGDPVSGLTSGHIYEAPKGASPDAASLNRALGADDTSRLLGFVVEDSRIGTIRFETWRPNLCHEGLLVWCRVAGQKVFYQITQGLTREEALESDRLGSQTAVAAQVGILDTQRGFVKCDWLPTMNTPVFSEAPDFGGDVKPVDGDFVYGTVPGTALRVAGPFIRTLDFHTAILGVTGSGKTELAFELIRHAAERGVKVICIDLTARYEGRLNDLEPRNLSLSAATTAELSAKLFAVETGTYGAGAEKKALNDLRSTLYKDITSKIETFLTSEGAGDRVGLLTLNEISNTQATLVVTELYMTCLLNYAKDHPESPETLVVVEEAHTVMPEPSTMGLGDYNSKGLVSKIAQIALQGRKYRVGLLVIAQRTATVSKNVLTQCNTVIALTSFDETTAGFLANVYGRTYADALRDLPQLHAVVFGKGVRSQRPIIVNIPYDPAKDEEGSMAEQWPLEATAPNERQGSPVPHRAG